MTIITKRCFRCNGAKKLYKVSGGYSAVNMGGVLVDCPLCLGVGQIDMGADPKATTTAKKSPKKGASRAKKQKSSITDTAATTPKDA